MRYSDKEARPDARRKTTRTGGRGMSGTKPRPGLAWRLAGGMLAARAQRTAEAVVLVPVLGPVPVRGTQVPGRVVEGAPPQHCFSSDGFTALTGLW